jgi:DNA repair protein RecO (recombination protein O)
MNASNRIHKVEAVVITHRDYGEADRILRAFTADLGKISIIAKGVRKSGSRKAPHIEPFTHSTLVLAQGQSFWILTQAETIDQFSTLAASLSRTGLAAYILELADRLTVDEQPDTALFRLLVEALRQINISDDAFIPACFFEIRILDRGGFRPELFRCVICRKEINPHDQFFSLELGGVVCPLCGQQKRELLRVSQETLKYLRHFQRSKFEKIKDLKLTDDQKNKMQKVLDPYTAFVTERKLNSAMFIQQITGFGK